VWCAITHAVKDVFDFVLKAKFGYEKIHKYAHDDVRVLSRTAAVVFRRSLKTHISSYSPNKALFFDERCYGHRFFEDEQTRTCPDYDELTNLNIEHALHEQFKGFEFI